MSAHGAKPKRSIDRDDVLTRRTRAYLDQERQMREAHACQIGLGQ